MEPTKLGLPLSGHACHVLFCVRDGMRADAAGIARQLTAWHASHSLTLASVVLSAKDDLVTGCEPLASRAVPRAPEAAEPGARVKCEPAGDGTGSMDTMLAGAKKRKMLPQDWERPSATPKVKPCLAWPSASRTRIEVGAHIVAYHTSSDAHVALDARGAGGVIAGALPPVRPNSIILVGRASSRGGVNKVRLLLPTEILMAKGFPQNAANLSMLSDTVARAVAANTACASVAIGALCSMAAAL